jgi:hypothetical protein
MQQLQAPDDDDDDDDYSDDDDEKPADKLDTVGEAGETNLMSSNVVGTGGLRDLKMKMDDAIKDVGDLSDDEEDYQF